MMPIAPVRATCVPPHADTSKSSTSTSRKTPSRFDSFRSGSAATSSASANRIVTGRFSQTTRLASCSASNLRRRDLAARSMVEAVEPRWKLTVGVEQPVEGAESTC